MGIPKAKPIHGLGEDVVAKTNEGFFVLGCVDGAMFSSEEGWEYKIIVSGETYLAKEENIQNVSHDMTNIFK